ncbi:hypothetical protein F2P81_002300 [Scophthalmus maximus]|uniref:Uncharacterized protein n=1 Tax=Scophthalmus maximus TaxID=52904 RepID=A0A6A4TSU0_SCOMX|nr:hypothetical protein F2P81_002300 [Scophthalmus maximus]
MIYSRTSGQAKEYPAGDTLIWTGQSEGSELRCTLTSRFARMHISGHVLLPCWIRAGRVTKVRCQQSGVWQCHQTETLARVLP